MGMGQQELKDILEKHRKWLYNEEGGERADLSSADLRYADLRSADLRYADLRYADLSSADLRYANLSFADLSSANLSFADLRYADLSSADLRYADLRSANLSYANLSFADLRSADLSSADLRYADLRSANLSYANLAEIKKDFFERLTLAKHETVGLYDYLMRGKVDGSSYEAECACFVGTVAKVAKENYDQLTSGLRPDVNSPTEKWFMGIREGDVPSSNQVSRITVEWIEEFAGANSIVLPKYKLVSSVEAPGLFV